MDRPPLWFRLYVEPAVVVAACISFGVAFSLVLWPTEMTRADFYTFWDSARWFREGVDPYFGHQLRPDSGYNLNPPALLFLFLPFSYWPLPVAFPVWTIVGLLAYALASVQLARTLRLSTGLVLCGLLISQASFAAFQLGQLTPLLLPLFTGAWLADRSGRPWIAGVLLGIVIAAKPFFGVFGLYALTAKQPLRLTAGIILGASGLWGLGLLAGGIDVYRSWILALRQVTYASHLANASLLAVVNRELTIPPNGVLITPVAVRPDWVFAIWCAAVALLVAIAAAARIAFRADDHDRLWLLFGVSALLISPLGWGYYAPLLAGPLIGRWESGSSEARVWLALGYLATCVPYTLLQRPFGTASTLIFASIYTWGFVAWFLAAVRA
jgi:hypothetical protein